MNADPASSPAPPTAGAAIVPEPSLPRRAQALVAALAVGALTLGALLADARDLPAGDASGFATGANTTGGSDAVGTAGAVHATDGVTEVTVRVAGMAFEPSRIEVPAGDRLIITLENTGDQRHDLRLASGAATAAIAPGEITELDAGIITATTDGWCSLAGHRAMGMELQIVAVSGDDAAVGAAHAAGAANERGIDEEVAPPTMAQLRAAANQATALPAELEPLTDETVREYTFTVTEATEVVADGVTRAVWTYNGTSPGPTLHGRVGDRFVVTLVNDGSMGHSIDFHAGELAPDGPMRTIEPGESLVYEFTADRAGVWMYHCGTMPMTQHIANGMFGVVIIEPADLAPVDREYVLVQSETYLGAEGGPASASKAATGIPDVVTFNGRAFQYAAHPLAAVVGERVRFWVLAAGPSVSLSFHVVGAQFDTVWTEGAYSVRHGTSADGLTRGATGAQVLPLLAAQGGFVEMVAPEPGHYAFVNHQMNLAEKGASGLLEVTAR